MKKYLSIIILISLFCINTVKSKEIEAFCLITTADVKDARLDPEENKRFAGKTIKLLLSFAKNNTEENLIVDLSDDNVVGLITGLYGGVDDIQKFKIENDGIRYSSTYDAKDGDKTVTYKYNNILRIPNNKPTSLFAIVDVKGFSMTTYRFQIDCKDNEYTAEEISLAKKKPTSDYFKKLGIEDTDEFFKKVQERLNEKNKKK
jgi:hypothetical protein